jgi:xanthine/uracil permease
MGAPGMDSFIYRQGGAATLGAGIGGVLVLLDRRWVTGRLPAIMAYTFNGLSVIAALLDIYAGTALPVTYVILAAAALVTVGTALAIRRGGR